MKRVAAATAFFAIMSGCAVGPDYRAPHPEVPQQWSTAIPQTAGAKQTPIAWWKTYNDPILNRLIVDAANSNLSLQQAETLIRDARALRKAAIAAGLPSLGSHANINRRRNNTSAAALSQTGTTSTTSSGGGFGIGNQIIDIFQMGFDAQWELDFFGGVRRAIEAADATLEMQEENRRDVLVTMLGEVARNYIDLRANQRLVAITENNLRAQQDIVAMTQARQRAGLASSLEVAQAQSQAATTQAQVPVYATLVQQSIHALSVLLGREPGALAEYLQRGAPIPFAAAPAVAELPSELLQRRPDIRRAERQLAVSNAQVGIATAELYPKVNLAAFLGLQNINIASFTPVGKSWSMAASLSLPIFNWGKLQANIKSKKAQYEQTLLAYQSTVLNAFQEVEDDLVAYVQEQQRRTALAEAVEANTLALELAKERYRKGLTAFLDVLVSQRALLETESELAGSDAKVSSNLVALYKALGGGWENQPQTGGRG
jgi:multidrug efflux system outer membrane protein